MDDLEEGMSWSEVAATHGVSDAVIRRVRRHIPNETTKRALRSRKTVVSLGETVGSLELDVNHPKDKPPRWLDIKNPEALLKHCEIDTSVWEPTNCRISSSEVTMKLRSFTKAIRKDTPKTFTNVHITVTLRRRKVAERAVLGFCEKLLYSKNKPPVMRAPRILKDSVLLEWCPYDQHHGMLAWGPEVDEHYDLRISQEFFAEAIRKVIDTAAPYNVGQIVVPIGQDWFHCNDPTNTTPMAKHHLDVEGRLIKVFETGYTSLFKAIELLRQVAPVHLMWVPGNHDPETSYYLIRALAAHYMDLDGSYNRGVTCDYSPRSRKVFSWGNSCIGFSHPVSKGSWEKQRGIFSEVFKREWADAKFHEIHTGHLHKAMEYGFMQADTLGSHTVIRMLPSLCATDKWHWEMGFVEKNRASASFIWSATDGMVCQYTTRVTDNRG
jgi:hypothetical protein